jgi:hypothetical protein
MWLFHKKMGGIKSGATHFVAAYNKITLRR